MVSELEDTESFETGFGHWPNAPGNDENWQRKSGSTSSSSTGPSSAYSGSYYIYVETSSGNAYSSGDTSIVEYNLVSVKNGYVDFYYHQYGLDQGTLYLEGYDGSWHTIWSSTGDHGNTWIHITRTFDGYSKLRFRNRAAGSFRGDVALDLIMVYVEVEPEPEEGLATVTVKGKATGGYPSPDMRLSVYDKGVQVGYKDFDPISIGSWYTFEKDITSLGIHNVHGEMELTNPVGIKELSTETKNFEIKETIWADHDDISHLNYSDHDDISHLNYSDHDDAPFSDHSDHDDVSHLDWADHSDAPFSDHDDHDDAPFSDHDDHDDISHLNYSDHDDAPFSDHDDHDDISYRDWNDQDDWSNHSNRAYDDFDDHLDRSHSNWGDYDDWNDQAPLM